MGRIDKGRVQRGGQDRNARNANDITFSYAAAHYPSPSLSWTDSVAHDPTLFHAGRVSDIGLLLSDQNPATSTVVRFAGDSKRSDASHATFHGSILSQLDAITQAIDIEDARHRWPQDALHETIVNALVHRDYGFSGPTMVNLFTTRIEVVSLGGLVGGLQVNDILNGVCQPRNPELAGVFELLGLTQNCGLGIQRILDAYDSSVISPQIRVAPTSVAMILPLPVTPEHLEGRERFAQDDDVKATHTRLYPFPAIHPDTTDDPTLALTGMRVIGTTGMQIAMLGRQLATWRIHEDGTVSLDPGSFPQIRHVETLEQITLHCLANAAVPLSRAQIQHTLGLNKNQTAHLLHTLSKKGKITMQGRSRATRYSLS